MSLTRKTEMLLASDLWSISIWPIWSVADGLTCWYGRGRYSLWPILMSFYKAPFKRKTWQWLWLLL